MSCKMEEEENEHEKEGKGEEAHKTLLFLYILFILVHIRNVTKRVCWYPYFIKKGKRGSLDWP